jgi:hypothetical protein
VSSSLDINSYLNLFDAVIIIGVSLPTLYISTRIKLPTIRILFGLLAAFLVVHGLYHLTYFLGDYTNSDAVVFGNEILQPLSYMFLFAFAAYFAKRGG